MAVTKITSSKLGEITTNFLLNDFDVYLMNTSATGGYVGTDWEKIGYTSAEKSMNKIHEPYTREDKIPRVSTFEKTIRSGLEITSGLSNQNDELLAIVMQGTRTDLGTGTGSRIAHGITEAPIEYRAIRFSSVLEDGTIYAITIPKCKLTLAGEKTLGGESEVVTDIMFKAVHNPSANGTASLFYENYWTSGISATADVPPAYT
jgi:hypothetical protein